jgi:hypothetical protein
VTITRAASEVGIGFYSVYFSEVNVAHSIDPIPRILVRAANNVGSQPVTGNDISVRALLPALGLVQGWRRGRAYRHSKAFLNPAVGPVQHASPSHPCVSPAM